ncbi:MAG: PhzF family phenazine biosynthesis protein [Gemmatimonadetes bacterium]|nr:PhzF family phenazine biosynthesis protein [Gemmatimonadota bacterium]
MSRHRFLQVDAFTTTALAGNPCAIVFDADELPVETMQAVALEMNLSETAFLMTSDEADVRARYFTPAEEIPLAGHPTIASMHALVEEGRLTLDGEREVSLQLEAGVIPVTLTRSPGGGIRVTMRQLAPRFERRYEARDVAPAFGLDPDDLVPDVPIETVSTGTRQLMIPVRSHDALRRARVDVDRYTALREEGDFFSPHLFCTEGATPAGDTFARHFGVPPDTPEDPFTGSATGGMAAFLWRHRMIPGPRFTAEQGHWMGRPGAARVKVLGPPDAIEGVLVAGEAVTVVEGVLSLP